MEWYGGREKKKHLEISNFANFCLTSRTDFCHPKYVHDLILLFFVSFKPYLSENINRKHILAKKILFWPHFPCWVARFFQKMLPLSQNANGHNFWTVHFWTKIFCKFHFGTKMIKITSNGQNLRGSLTEVGRFLQTMALKQHPNPQMSIFCCVISLSVYIL